MAGKSAETTREAVGVFHDLEAFKDAVDELTSTGFDRADLSLLASQQTVEEKLGHAYHRVKEVEGDASVPRATYADDHSIAEARTGRLLPGDGVLPLRELISALPIDAPLAIEAPVRATAHLPAIERAQRAYQALSELLAD